MKRYFTICCMLLAGALSGQNYTAGDELLVIAQGGLNLREEPNTQARILKQLSSGEKVRMVSDPKNGKPALINGMKGHWVEIESDNTTGFVFDAYLTKLPAIEKGSDSEGSCIFNTLKEYVVDQLGMVDSLEYCNGIDGEARHRMTIFSLQNDHQYIEHFYWESYASELQLYGIRNSEGIQLVNHLLQNCGITPPQWSENAHNLERTELLPVGEFCCYFTIRRFDNKFIIYISGGL